MESPGADKRNTLRSQLVLSRIDIESDYYKKNLLPVDHGWAWVICFAGFLVYFVFGISNQTMVVLFIEIIYYYDTTVTTGSLVFMFSIFAVGLTSILSTNFLAPRFGERIVVSVAGIINMFGTVGLSFAPNIFAFIGFSVVKGLATGAVFVPSISLIRLYFSNRRSIAQIIANVGQSVAVIIAPPIVRITRKVYGIHGTFMIVAGIELHMTLAGLLLRPVPPQKGAEDNKQIIIGATLISEDYNELRLRKESVYTTVGRKLRIMTSIAYNMRRSSTFGPKSDTSIKAVDTTAGSNKQNVLPTFASADAASGSVKLSDKPTSRTAVSSGAKCIAQQNSTTAASASCSENIKFLADITTVQSKSNETVIKTNALIYQEERKRNVLFYLIIFATIPGSANLYLRNYVPAIMDGQGITYDQGAFLLTIVGIMDLISRLCIGLFADLHILSSFQIIVIAQLCLAVVCHCLQFFKTFETLIVYVILIGCFVGTRITALPLLSLEIVGVERMPQTLSIISTVGTLSSACMNPIFGYIAELDDNNFVNVMHTMGGCFTLSSCIMISVPYVIHFWQIQRTKIKKKNVTGMLKKSTKVTLTEIPSKWESLNFFRKKSYAQEPNPLVGEEDLSTSVDTIKKVGPFTQIKTEKSNSVVVKKLRNQIRL